MSKVAQLVSVKEGDSNLNLIPKSMIFPKPYTAFHSSCIHKEWLFSEHAPKVQPAIQLVKDYDSSANTGVLWQCLSPKQNKLCMESQMKSFP